MAKYRFAVVAACLIAGVSLRASAQDPAARKFYEGQTIHWFVGSGPGGGFDQYARLIAPEL